MQLPTKFHCQNMFYWSEGTSLTSYLVATGAVSAGFMRGIMAA